MKIFTKMKDGGPDSPVEGYFLFECKWLFSVALLKFNKGGREAFHTHAFNALTWFLKGELEEEDISGEKYKYSKSIFPKITLREKTHRVLAYKDSWCFTLRGPWVDTWTEVSKEAKTYTVFTHGRRVLARLKYNM